MSKSQGKESEANYKIKDHQLYFTRIGTLIKLFSENKVSKGKRWMVVRIFFFALLTQVFQQLQRLFIFNRLRKVDFKKNPPIFILGHWRSGTTHLHYLMGKDPKLGFAANYHGFLINLCVLGKGWLDKWLAPFVPDKRPMDNMKMTMFAPSEEDQSVANISTAIGVHSFFFPRNRGYFNRYTTFRDASPKDVRLWKKAYDEVLRIISITNKGKERLVIKNPNNTARPKELLELYPGSKFIYIHRNPYEVYRSTRKLYKNSTETQFLQEMSEQEIQDMIFLNYTELMKAYIEKRDSIPAGDLIEISYDELDEDSEGTMRRIYEELNLPGFEETLPIIQHYLTSVRNYKKNEFKPLPPEIVSRIQTEWAFAFEEWGYSLEHSEFSMKSTKKPK